MKKIFLIVLVSIFIQLSFSQDENKIGYKTGHPDDDLPPYVEKVCGFGERPDWSHDGKKILFVDKPHGEVYELDLETKLISPKTRHFMHYGFTRALYMSNGDILLSGPNKSFDVADVEARDKARDLCWLFVLDKSGTKPPTPLNVLCAEGPALSRHTLKVAYTHRDKQIPELGKNRALLKVADIVYVDGVPEFKNEKVVFDSKTLPFELGHASLEAQNLVPPKDDKLIFTAYLINHTNNTDAYIVDINTGEYKSLTNSAWYYDEAEGVFPDGKYTCVEHNSSKETAWPLVDNCKLRTDGSGEMQRLTYFSDYKGYKGNQGVVSDDGKYLCFQIGKSGDEAGVGYGFYVMNIEEAEKHLGPFKNYNDTK